MPYIETEEKELRAPNGHFLYKSGGNTAYDGPLENLPYPAPSTPLAEQVARMYSDGCVIFPGVLDREEVTTLRAIMDEKGGPDDAKWVVEKWCYNRHQVTDFWQDPRLLTYIDRPGVIDVVRAIQDPGAHVTGGSFWTTGKGRSMGIHVDFQPFGLPESVHNDPEVKIPIQTSTAHYYLNDMVVELGPTTIVPGSHKAGRAPHGETSWHGITPKAVMVKAGDVCLFRGDVWHGSGMNSHPTERRYMMQVHYGTGCIRTDFPPMRYKELWNPAVIEAATPEQRILLGDR